MRCTQAQVIVEHLEWALGLRGRKLSNLSPPQIVALIRLHLEQTDSLKWTTSTLMVRLATTLVTVYSNPARDGIQHLVRLLLDCTTNVIFDSTSPPILFPQGPGSESYVLLPEALLLPSMRPFNEVISRDPELMGQYFSLVKATTERFSDLWGRRLFETTMISALIALTSPQLTPAFTGAAELHVKVQEVWLIVDETFKLHEGSSDFTAAASSRVRHLCQCNCCPDYQGMNTRCTLMTQSISLPAPAGALPILADLLKAILDTKVVGTIHWINLLNCYVTEGHPQAIARFKRVYMCPNHAATLEAIREYWNTLH